ncbi:hypothetical protein XENOCAPTIV_030678 [Xenoophorus captivus]|uniref:Secreted protein n=1 Tax=Xenoophorus captivus TaxID=1517983 RepID=A0ABV0QFF2_9TELE
MWCFVLACAANIPTSLAAKKPGKMRVQLMKVLRCSSSGKRRRYSDCRPIWPIGCPGPTSTLQTSPCSDLMLQHLTFRTPFTILYRSEKERFVFFVTQHLKMYTKKDTCYPL